MTTSERQRLFIYYFKLHTLNVSFIDLTLLHKYCFVPTYCITNKCELCKKKTFKSINLN